MHKASNGRNENKSNRNNTRIVGDLHMHHIVIPVKNGKRMKYTSGWYGCKPNGDTIGPLQYVVQHLTAKY